MSWERKIIYYRSIQALFLTFWALDHSVRADDNPASAVPRVTELEELKRVPVCSWVPQDIIECDIIVEPVCQTVRTRECDRVAQRRCRRPPKSGERKKCSTIPFQECKRKCFNKRVTEIEKCKVVTTCDESDPDDCRLEKICYTKPLTNLVLRKRCIREYCQRCDIVDESNDIEEDCTLRESGPECREVETEECLDQETEVCQTRPGEPVFVCDEK